MTRFRLGTRKSALAQVQARWVAKRLQNAIRDLSIEVVLISTSGDALSSNPPSSSAPGPVSTIAGGLKAMFTKELEEALLDNRIDLAVHSLKDMAAELPEGLILAAVPEREDPRDVWIGKRGVRFSDLPAGATVATGAVRRQAQLRHARPDLKLAELRGNVDTRLNKLETSPWDGIVLALAGLKRLGREKAATEVFSTDLLLPAVGQGALAIETRAQNSAVQRALQGIDHPASHQAVRAERAFLKALGGTCQTPIAGHAQVSGKRLTLTGLVVGTSGEPYLKASEEGSSQEPEAVGEQLATLLLSRGAAKLIT